MEREKLENNLKEIGIKLYWVLEKNLEEEIKSLLGKRSYYLSPHLNLNLKDNSPLEEAEVGIFEVLGLCKKTGTILVLGDELSSLVPPVSLAILKEKNIIEELDGLIDLIKENPEKSYAFITGPSRTADIEKQLVIPAHGPKELILIIYS